MAQHPENDPSTDDEQQTLNGSQHTTKSNLIHGRLGIRVQN